VKGHMVDTRWEAMLGAGLAGRVLFVGVGCRGRGDDGLGPELAGRLLSPEAMAKPIAARPCPPASGLSGPPVRDRWLRALDCGERPEDFTADMAAAEPDTVVFVDAVDMSAEPGAVGIFGVGDTAAAFPETHRTSLRVVMQYVGQRTGAAVWLLGVQPGTLCGPHLSPEVARTVDLLTEGFGGARPETGPS
jgi:hydrogenase maturation protease